MQGPQNHVGLSPQGEFSTAPATPAPQETEFPWGEITGYRLGTTGIQIPARQKIFKKSEKNEDFKNTREHMFISQLVITIGFRWVC